MDIEKIPTQGKKVSGAVDAIVKLKDNETKSGTKGNLNLRGIAKELAKRNASKK